MTSIPVGMTGAGVLIVLLGVLPCPAQPPVAAAEDRVSAEVDRHLANLEAGDVDGRIDAARQLYYLSQKVRKETGRPMERPQVERILRGLMHAVETTEGYGPMNILRFTAEHVAGDSGPHVNGLVKWLDAIVRENTRDLRYPAVEALGEIGPGAKSAAPTLAELVRRPADHTRCETLLRVLARMGPEARGTEPAVRDLIATVRDTPQPGDGFHHAGLKAANVRLSGFLTLDALGVFTADDVRPLARAMAGTEYRLRAEHATEVLLKMKELPPDIAPDVVAALLTPYVGGHDPHADSLHRLAVRMGEVAVPPLLEAIRKRNTPDHLYLCGDAMRVLRTLGPKAKAALPDLVLLLKEQGAGGHAMDVANIPSGPWVGETIAAVGEDAVEPVAALLNEKNPRVRTLAVWTLGRIGTKSTLPHLNAALKDEDANVRAAAAKALDEIRKDAPPPDLPVPDDEADRLIAQLKDQDPNVREKAIVALQGLRDRRAVEPLIILLDDKSIGVWTAAARALGRLGDARAVKPLLDRIGKMGGFADVDCVVAGRALGEIGDDSVLPVLIQKLVDNDGSVRADAAEGIQEMIRTAPEDPLWRRLTTRYPDVTSDPTGDAVELQARWKESPAADRLIEPIVQRLPVTTPVLWVLGQLDRERLRGLLMTRLSDADTDVRRRAAQVLGQLGEKRAIPKLIELLSDKETWVRTDAAEALGRLGDKQAVEPLMRLLEDAERPARRAAALALGRIGDPRAVEPLVRRLGREGWWPSQAVITALGDLGDKRAVEPLIGQLEDEEGPVRCAAAVALGKLGDARAVEFLVAHLVDERDDVAEAAGVALGQLKATSATPRIIAMLEGWVWPFQASAAAALGELRDPRAVQPLIAALGDENRSVRGEAALSLGKLASDAAATALTSLLSDADDRVRASAALALGNLRDPRAVKPLTDVLGDRSLYVRWAAITALGKIGDTGAVEPLLGRMADADWLVRKTSAEALGRLGGKRAVETLINHVNETNWRVRRPAASALKKITGQDFGTDGDLWRRWWQTQKAKP